MGARGLVTAVFSCTQLMFTDPCACWALLMPKLGSEHGRGVDQALWAGVEQPQPRPTWEEGPPDRLDAKGRLIWVGFTEGQAASQG